MEGVAHRMAAKMFEWRKPKRTSTESMAQPMAEKIATISANIGVKLSGYPLKASAKPSPARFATDPPKLPALTNRTATPSCTKRPVWPKIGRL
jgi:hypothetical protein